MRLTAIAALSFVFAPPALAQDGTVVHPKVQAMFPLGEEVCYSASFKRQDMKAGQKLTAIQMYRLFDPNPLKEAVEFTREEGDRPLQRRVSQRFLNPPLRRSSPRLERH